MLILATLQRSCYFWSHNGIHRLLLAHGHNWYTEHHLRSTLYLPLSSTSSRKTLGENCIFFINKNMWWKVFFFCLNKYFLLNIQFLTPLWISGFVLMRESLHYSLFHLAFQIKHEGQWRSSVCLQPIKTRRIEPSQMLNKM